MRAAKARLQSRKWRGDIAPRVPNRCPRRNALRRARRIDGAGVAPWRRDASRPCLTPSGRTGTRAPMPASPPTADPQRAPISACVITLNEADRIDDCLRSLAWCDETVVIDSHSTDATRAHAAALGARVVERDWPGHAAQKEFAVRAARHDWVFCVDADERVSPDLRTEIQALAAQGFPGAAGWSMPRLSCYLGRSIRHGTWYPDRTLRLFDRRRGRVVTHHSYDLHER